MKDLSMVVVSIILLVMLALLAINYNKITGSAVQENYCLPYDRIGMQTFNEDENLYGKVSVALGDVNLDGYDEIITGAGDFGNSIVRAHSIFGKKVLEFTAFDKEENPNGDVYVAAGDVDGDGLTDIVAGTGVEAKTAIVRSFDHDGHKINDVVAFDSNENPKRKVTVALSDINDDGYDEVITGAGGIGKSKVKIFDRNYNEIKEFDVMISEDVRDDVYVAAGDVVGDGKDEIIIGSGNSKTSKSLIEIYDTTGKKIKRFNAINSNNGMVTVAAGDVVGDGKDEIIAGSGAKGNVVVVYNANGNALYNIQPMNRFSNNGGEISVASLNLFASDKEEIVAGSGISGSSYVSITELMCGIDVDCVDNDNDGSCHKEDCLDINDRVYPGAIELCDGIDNNCNGDIDEKCGVCIPFSEVCNDGLDNDCDTKTDCEDNDCESLEKCIGEKNKCDDGTAFGACSTNKPYYCAAGKILKERCTICNCDGGRECNKGTGKCSEINDISDESSQDETANIVDEKAGVEKNNLLIVGLIVLAVVIVVLVVMKFKRIN